MTDQRQINQLAEALEKLGPIGRAHEIARPWRFSGVDPMTGCLAYRCDELGTSLYCTPGYDREHDDWIVCSPSDDAGNILDDDRAIPFAFLATPEASAEEFRRKIVPQLRMLERAYPYGRDGERAPRPSDVMTGEEKAIATQIATWLRDRNRRAREANLDASARKTRRSHPGLFGRIEGEEAAAAMIESGAWKRGPG